MAKRKRESSAASTTPRKSKKRAPSKAEAQPSSSASLPHPHGEIDFDKEYKVREIIGEKKGQYHISWENDSETGEAYPPTWEPKENANESAIADWKEKKAAKNPRGRQRAKSAISKPQRQSPALTAAGTPVRRGRERARKNVIVESSSPPLSSRPVNDTGVGDNELLEIGESQQSLATIGTLSQLQASPPPKSRLQTPKYHARELTVQVPDPPSSYDRGAYYKVCPQSISNGAVSGTVDPSVPLPAISEVDTQSPQPGEDDHTTRVVPDSQSQGHCLEDSTFRGFSPTQQLQLEIESSVVKGPEQHSDAVPDTIEEAFETSRLPIAGAYKDVGFEAQASEGAERAQITTEDQIEDVQAEDNSTTLVLEANSAHIFSDPAPARASIPSDGIGSSAANSDRPSCDETVASAGIRSRQQSSARTSTEEQRSISPEIRSQKRLQASTTQEGRLEESNIKSQAETPLRTSSQPSHQLEDYIVISAEEDLSSTLGLLTQPEYNPPPAGQRPLPSSLLSVDIPQTKSVNEIEISVHRTSTTLGSTQSSFPFETQQPISIKIENEARPRAVFTPRIASPRSWSQIPSLPSQSIVTIGESAPARLLTPSPISTAGATGPATMESNSSANSLLAQLNAVTDSGKARRRARRSNTPAATMSLNAEPTASAIPPNISAEVIASQARHGDGGRSPSTVPALELEPVVSKEEMRTSGRLPTLVSLSHEAAAEDNHGTLTVSERSRLLHDDPEQSDVHIIPIAFGNIQRDQYKNGFQWYQGGMQTFLDGDDSSERFTKARAALDELRQIAIHPDLINSEAYSQPLSTPEQAQWDADASCKFRFLRDLLEQLRSQDQDTHVVVAANGVIILEMLDNFLKATGVSHSRLTSGGLANGVAGLQVSILDLDAEVRFVHFNRADVVVAIDGVCNTQDPLIQAARRAERDNKWAPLLVLVAPYTVEHIQRALLPSMADTTRVRTLLKTALKLQLQGVAGKMTASQTSSRDAAIAIAKFIASPTDWPIEDLGTIDNLDSQTETDIEQTLNGGSSSIGKRSLEIDVDTLVGSLEKRPRGSSSEGQGDGTLLATINPQEIELTHISDSIGKATQSALDDSSILTEVEQLRRILSEKQDELLEHVKAMSDLQYRHEDQHVELAKTKNERDEAIITAENAVTRMSLAANQSAELRTERTELKDLLAEANSKLLSHAIPERREVETLRLALEQEKLAKAKAERRYEQAQKDSEYSRELYQNTSSHARELAQQIGDLESRLVLAERIAAGEQAKVRQATNEGRDQLLAKENKKLKALLVDREAGMKFKDEEIARLKEAGRGRMGTRGSSVPRSPRMGSPALKGRTSRQTSPAAGEGKGKHLHPLRNG